MRLIIDRIEGGIAVCETESGGMVEVPSAALPEVREGDVVSITVDAEARAERERDTGELMQRLWRK